MSRRIDQRRDVPRILQGVTVTAKHDAVEQVCILENASKQGAGLRVNPHAHLPKRFILVLGEDRVPVTLRWRQDDRIGVKFASPGQEQPFVRRLLERLVGRA
jgi:hypothetical protein